MATRRIVTGHVDGRTTISADGSGEPTTLLALPSMSFIQIWGCRSVPTVTDADQVDLGGPYFPEPGGVRVVRTVIRPEGAPSPGDPVDMDSAMAEAEVKVPGMFSSVDA